MPLTQVSSRAIEDTLRYVLGASGSDHYTFTGKGLTGAVNDPTLTLSRGHTYIFENRSGGHPFYIKTSIANGGTNDAYNTGVTNNGGAGGTEIVFTVPHDAPDLLYYQCSSHINMAGQLKIAGGGVADGSITEDKLADDAVTSDKIAANPVLTGTSGIKVPVGNTSERVNTQGMVRFNSTTGLLEYYDGTSYKGLDISPTVSSVNTNNFESSALPTNIVITGSNFSSSVTVKFTGTDGTAISSPSVTRDSATQITAQIPNTVTSVNEPYEIQVTNTSTGFSGILENAFNIDAAPVFGVASGSLGTLGSLGAGSSLTAVTATDDEGDTVTFSVTAGSLPSGITLNSNGTFSGTASQVSSTTTSTFSVTASDGTNTSVRQYTITVNPVYVQLTLGSGTWTPPSGVNSAEILIVGGGASGSRSPNVSGGGGGAGGILHNSNHTFSATEKSNGIAYVVGAGGLGVGMGSGNGYDGGYRNGEDTTFALSTGTLVAKGGGGGAGYGGNSPHLSGFGQAYYGASQGGSGGGGAFTHYTGASSNQTTYSGWTAYGNAGGDGHSDYTGGGGGGAGGAGGDAGGSNAGGAGGAGQLFSSFTAYGENGYFGGGGAGGAQGSTEPQGGIGGGGNGGYGDGTTQRSGGDAINGTGGGGGGVKNIGYNTYTYRSGNGGAGIILIKY